MNVSTDGEDLNASIDRLYEPPRHGPGYDTTRWLCTTHIGSCNKERRGTGVVGSVNLSSPMQKPYQSLVVARRCQMVN